MKIEYMSTDALIPYARNAKLHNETQVAKIAGSIREFGFNNPVLVDDSNPPTIIAGHGRVLAAKKLGLAEIPCIRLKHLTDDARRAYTLADNRLGELGGGWDMEMLHLELDELSKMDISIDDLGFAEDLLSSASLELLSPRLESPNKKKPTTEPPEEFDMADAPEANKTSPRTSSNDSDTFRHECPQCGYKFN